MNNNVNVLTWSRIGRSPLNVIDCCASNTHKSLILFMKQAKQNTLVSHEERNQIIIKIHVRRIRKWCVILDYVHVQILCFCFERSKPNAKCWIDQWNCTFFLQIKLAMNPDLLSLKSHWWIERFSMLGPETVQIIWVKWHMEKMAVIEFQLNTVEMVLSLIISVF